MTELLSDEVIGDMQRLMGDCPTPRKTKPGAIIRDGKTPAEVGERLGIPANRISKIEIAALAKARTWRGANGLNPDQLIRGG